MTYMEGYRPFRKTHFTLYETSSLWYLTRALPPGYGDWKNTHRRFSRRCHKGIWKRIVEIFSINTDYELLTTNPNCFKVRSYVSDAEGNNRVITAQKEGSCLVLWYRIL